VKYLSKYQYTNPIDKGYTKFILTKKQHNEIFKNRQMKWMGKCEYYYNENQIIIHSFTNWKAILLSTILFPVFVLLHGIANINEVWKELLSLYNQKEKGSFVSEHIWKTENRYEQIMNIINKSK
jgi:hypothetical protein